VEFNEQDGHSTVAGEMQTRTTPGCYDSNTADATESMTVNVMISFDDLYIQVIFALNHCLHCVLTVEHCNKRICYVYG